MQQLLEEHRGYLEDAVKLRQYQAAISSSVKAGDVVLDLGCGTGVLGLMALRAGARRVYAIEEKPVLEIARRTFAQAGFGERAHCLRGSSFELNLPEQVDVIVCDHVGYFGIDYGILAMLDDARKRFLKPGGIVLPAEIRLWLALASMQPVVPALENWRHAVPPDYRWVSALAANTKLSSHLAAEVCNGAPALVQTLNLSVPSAEFYSWSVTLLASRAGSVDALAGWFDCRLACDIWMTNSPLATEKLRRPQMLLAFETPPALQPDDVVTAALMLRPAEHLLAWKLTMASGRQLAQSSWNNPLLNVPAAHHGAGCGAPALNQRGRARKLLLDYCDGKRTADEIMQVMKQRHADLFPSETALENFVHHVLARDAGQ